MSSTGFTSLNVLLLFPLSITFFVFTHRFDAISSYIDEVVSINSSANVFVFGGFNVHHKNWLTYSGKPGRSSRTDRPSKLCYDFFISNGFTQMLKFPTCISDCDSHSPVPLDSFISSYTSICSTMAFSPLGEILIMWLSQFPLTFHQTQKNEIPRFIA